MRSSKTIVKWMTHLLASKNSTSQRTAATLVKNLGSTVGEMTIRVCQNYRSKQATGDGGESEAHSKCEDDLWMAKKKDRCLELVLTAPRNLAFMHISRAALHPATSAVQDESLACSS